MQHSWPTISRSEKVGFYAAFILAAVLVGAELFFVLHGSLNADEGFYLIASQRVAEGFRPYRDFGFTQGAVLPWVNLPALMVFGFTLEGIRLGSLVWVLGTFGLAAWGLRRAGSWWGAAFFFALLLGAPLWLEYAVKGKTYAFGGLAVMLGILAVLLPGAWWKKWTAFLLAAGLGVGARFPLAGFFIPAAIVLLAATPGWNHRAVVVLVGVAAAAGELVWMSAGNWDNFLFWTVRFHQASELTVPASMRWWDGLRTAPALWAGLIAAGFSLARRKSFLELALLISLLFGVGANLSSRATYAEYIFPFLPALAFLCARALIPYFFGLRWYFITILVVVVLLGGWNRPPDRDMGLLELSREAELFLRSRLPGGSTVACSMSEIPVAAGMRVPLEMTMAKFGLTADMSETDASRRKMLTPTTLRRILVQPETRAVVLSGSYSWNYSWSAPSYRFLSLQAQNGMRDLINQNYWLAFDNGKYLVFLRKSE